jgi:hypothetical protein
MLGFISKVAGVRCLGQMNNGRFPFGHADISVGVLAIAVCITLLKNKLRMFIATACAFENHLSPVIIGLRPTGFAPGMILQPCIIIVLGILTMSERAFVLCLRRPLCH